jgi:uncharacterized protein YkvS
MKLLSSIVDRFAFILQKTSQKRAFSVVLISLSCVTIISLFSIYQINSSLWRFRKKFFDLSAMSQESELLLIKNQKLSQKSAAIVVLQDDHKLKKGLRGFLEKILEKSELTIDPAWKNQLRKTPIPGQENFEEESVALSLQTKSMEQLVGFFEAIRNEPVIVLRELEIAESNKDLKVQAGLGARRRKG